MEGCYQLLAHLPGWMLATEVLDLVGVVLTGFRCRTTEAPRIAQGDIQRSQSAK